MSFLYGTILMYELTCLHLKLERKRENCRLLLQYLQASGTKSCRIVWFCLSLREVAKQR